MNLREWRCVQDFSLEKFSGWSWVGTFDYSVSPGPCFWDYDYETSILILLWTWTLTWTMTKAWPGPDLDLTWTWSLTILYYSGYKYLWFVVFISFCLNIMDIVLVLLLGEQFAKNGKILQMLWVTPRQQAQATPQDTEGCHNIKSCEDQTLLWVWYHLSK